MIHKVRLLTQQDYETVQSYLDEDPLFNIHLIYGLLTFGLDSKHAKFWGAFRGDQLEGVLFTDVLLADYDNSPRFGCLAGNKPTALAELGKFAQQSGVKFLKGKNSYIQPVAEALSSQLNKLRLTHWNFYRADQGQTPSHSDYPVRLATRDDIPLLIELYKDFEFGGRNLGHLEFEVQKAVDRSACFMIEIEGQAASATMIVAETDRAGILNYSRTAAEFRGRGLHLSVRAACYGYLFSQGKVAVGVFSESNTAMQQIIAKYGSIIGKWSIVYFPEKITLRRRILPLAIRKLGVYVKSRILGQ